MNRLKADNVESDSSGNSTPDSSQSLNNREEEIGITVVEENKES